MYTDLILDINLCFNAINQAANKDGQQQANEFIKEFELELNQLTTEQQVLKIKDSLCQLEKEWKSMKGKEYAHDIASEAVTHKLFLARCLFHDRNDESLIRRAIYLNEKKQLLEDLYREKLALLPASTFKGFLSTDTDAGIHDLKERINRKGIIEYLAIKNWQTERTLECVRLQSSRFKERFIVATAAFTDKTAIIKAEIQQIDLLLQPARPLKPKQLIREILKLMAIDPGWKPDDVFCFHQSYKQYLAGDYEQPSFNAPFLLATLDKIQNNKIPDAPFFCWSLTNYKKRLEWALKYDPDLLYDYDAGFDTLFLSTFMNEFYHRNKVLPAFKKKYSSKSLSREEYKLVVLAEMEKYRIKYNELSYPEYYHLLLAAPGINGYKLRRGSFEHPDFFNFYMATAQVRNYFVNNCLNGKDIDKHTNALTQAIQLYSMMLYLIQELTLTDENYFNAKMKETVLDCKIIELIVCMVPSEDILDQLMEAASSCFTQAKARVPLYFISENLKRSLQQVYSLAADHMPEFFKTQCNDKKRWYITEQIKEIKYTIKKTSKEEPVYRSLLKEVKELFEIELECIQLQAVLPPYDFEHNITPGAQNGHLAAGLPGIQSANEKMGVNPLLAFSYDNACEDRLPLMFEALKKLKAIPPEVTLPQFRKLFNGQEVLSPIRWLAGQGDLRVFIKEVIKSLKFPYLQHWHIAVKCFIRADGTVFNSQSLKSAKPTDKARRFVQAGGWLKG